jgi:branched-subunit amino acid ABC-type transport system permease component
VTVVDVIQLVWNGVAVGSMIAVAAVGLTLMIGILNFLNIAYAEYLTLGAYFAFAANTSLGVSVPTSVLLGTAGMAVGAVAVDKMTFEHFRSRHGLTLLVVSIGVSFVMRNAIQAVWGPGPKRFDTPIREAPLVFGVRMLPEQVASVAVGLLILAGVYFILRRTAVGLAMRAASNNIDLARIRGIDTERLVFYVWVVTGAIAGFAWSILAVQTQLSPLLGFELLLTLFAAIVLGGIGSPTGAVVAGYVIGIAQELSVAVIPPEYKAAVGMAILVIALLFKPEGLFGHA